MQSWRAYWLIYLAKDNKEERDNHNIVSLNEYISLQSDLSILRLTQQSPAAHAKRSIMHSVQ